MNRYDVLFVLEKILIIDSIRKRHQRHMSS